MLYEKRKNEVSKYDQDEDYDNVLLIFMKFDVQEYENQNPVSPILNITMDMFYIIQFYMPIKKCALSSLF